MHEVSNLQLSIFNGVCHVLLELVYYFWLLNMRNTFLKYIIYILCINLILLGCNYQEPKKIEDYVVAANEPKTPINIDYEVSQIIKNYLQDIDTSIVHLLCNDSIFAGNYLYHFYKKNNFKNIWVKYDYANPLLDSLLNLLYQAPNYGLILKDYHYHRIDSLLQIVKTTPEKSTQISAMAKTELLLSDALFTMAIHVNKGRLNKDNLTREWKGELSDTSLINAIYISIEKRNIKPLIASLEPKNEEYLAVKAELKNFKREFENSHWDSLFYESSDSTSFEERLIKRLKASHDYFDEYSGNTKQKLETAIKNFQCKHNLTEDGKVGKLTFKALQKTKQDYIHQLEMNMERWRLYPKPKDVRYAWINIPFFKMKVIENDSVVLESRVIVGEPEHPTPILHSSIRYFLIYPYWNVPRKIATKEILPILKNNPQYLIRNNFEVLNRNNEVVNNPINWEKYDEDNFPFKLRQRMGDDNALGILKFYFNNKYGVYLHDTNNKKLFKSDNRALSHGCIRLEKYIDFAIYLINSDNLKYSENNFKHDILQEEQKYVYLKKLMPIYTTYYTIDFAYDNKQLVFLNDIYNYDTKMVNYIYFYRNK
jgi:L,D-transpeptidase YcbB